MITSPPAGTTSQIRPLASLLREADLPAAGRPGEPGGEGDDAAAVEDRAVGGITVDSRTVSPGDLFVAIPGTQEDAHRFLGEAVARGAVALVVEREPASDPGVPVVRVDDARIALARLAAAWHGHPGERLRLVGITGTIAKTTVLRLLEEVLRSDGHGIGAIGSLGVRVGGEDEPTGHTAPDPLTLHAALRRIVEAGQEVAAMEVTSHALDQHRVHGLRYDLGVFTNLVPLEHAEYHPSFRQYVETKVRFFDHLAPGAPLVFHADDPSLRDLARRHDVAPVGAGVARDAAVRIEETTIAAEGTTFTLAVRTHLPRLDGGVVEPQRLPVELALLGRMNVANAAVAAAAALCLGAAPASIQATLRAVRPAKRRMELIPAGPFRVLDSTLGHPDSVSATFEVVEHLPVRRLHAVFAVRGSRGRTINRRLAETLAIWHGKWPHGTLMVTRSEEAADERNRVTEGERRAFLSGLRAGGVEWQERDRLDEAIATVLEQAGEGDLVLLLGAQGMDAGAGYVARWLEEGGAGG